MTVEHRNGRAPDGSADTRPAGTPGEPAGTPGEVTGAPGPSFQELLDRESRPVPATLRRTGSADLGTADIGLDRYHSRAWYDREVARVWKRVWQVACREEDLPEIGDTTLYDVADISLLLVRTAQGIRAYHNSCLHRGRPLRTEPGRVDRLRCPFHGFTWALDGTLASVPTPWDFEHLDRRRNCLPEAHVDTWAGWVFVNVADDPPPLHEQLGGIVEHWRAWQEVPRAKVAHYVKPLPCNWKLGLEAFLESYHTLATHPQLLSSLDDVNTEYDVYEHEPHFNRMISAQGVPSPHLPGGVEEAEILRGLVGGKVALDGTRSARRRVADLVRGELGRQAGRPVECTDSEAIDGIQYFVFPNFVPWGGYAPIAYRFLPDGDDPGRSVLDLMFLAPHPAGARPGKVEPVYLAQDEPFASVPAIRRNLAAILDQDMANLAVIQRGVRCSRKGAMSLARYQESRIRHFETTLDGYLDGPDQTG
jgi:nitrite reductase/ring-hydroxylating ferredoxin subunit